MVNPHHLAHWYPTAAYLYVFGLDALALAWEYLRRHPDYRLDWLRRHRRPDTAHRWGLRLLEDPALDARDAHPAWLPGHAAVVQLYPDADPSQDAATFAFWRIPGHKQLLHDGKGLALIARSPGHCLRFALAPGLEDGMAVAYAQRSGAAAPARGRALHGALAAAKPRPTPTALLELSRIATLEPPKIGVMAPLASDRNRGLGRAKNQVFLTPLASADFGVFSDRADGASGSGRGAR
ncbi:DUF7011 domain-containing protein [Pseudomonas aeruginosa]|uniref:DUF7011 domain-containing protein n=1 Tax=Pseudomonas aeruginosa TaxID=287 RepID=UPI002162F1DE|nr:hypothetical protein [Pseudomonas aeruginosa]